jgi:hypothetical protein
MVCRLLGKNVMYLKDVFVIAVNDVCCIFLCSIILVA